VSRRTPPLAVALLSQAAGSAALLLAALLLGEAPDALAIAWGAAAGVMNGFAYGLYMQGLARGKMGVVSTLTAVWSALVPVLAGLVQGERPGGLAVSGAAAVLVGVALVSAGKGGTLSPGRRGGRAPGRGGRGWPQMFGPGLAEGTLAGVCYGLAFVLLKQAGSGGTLWPALATNAAAAALLGAALWAVRSPIGPAVPYWPMVAGMGLLHALAVVGFVLATREGMLSIVSVVANLGPAPTTLLAWRLAGETLQPSQTWGIILGLAGIALLTAAA